MERIFFRIYAYISHLVKRKDEHSLHSPFLFDFYCKVIKGRSINIVPYIENYRASLLKNYTHLVLKNWGNFGREEITTVRLKAASSLSPKDQSCFLGAIVAYLNPLKILEIGTSFGVSTSYLAHHNPVAEIISLDGSESIAAIASENFEKASIQNVKLIIGKFEETLPLACERLKNLDLVFFDGNHQYQATISYFELCLKYANLNSVFIFHDIYWSRDMKKAWNAIRSDQRVSLSIDLFYFGIVFFNKNQPKQHFVLKF